MLNFKVTWLQYLTDFKYFTNWQRIQNIEFTKQIKFDLLLQFKSNLVKNTKKLLLTGADFVNMFGAKFYDKLMQKFSVSQY